MKEKITARERVIIAIGLFLIRILMGYNYTKEHDQLVAAIRNVTEEPAE